MYCTGENHTKCFSLLGVYCCSILQLFSRETFKNKWGHRHASLLLCSIQGQIEYRSRIENWRILWVTSPGDSTAHSQCSYIWPAELRNLHSQTFILEMLVVSVFNTSVYYYFVVSVFNICVYYTTCLLVFVFISPLSLLFTALFSPYTE